METKKTAIDWHREDIKAALAKKVGRCASYR
ncbi:Uncharacterised protein [Aggregatibacter aphrophilus]|uniref:Uncharacterized protein n=1 Tax=Aggregatibacter aphrophilus TaxID=732 RepID=A0A336N620_AGGAP|nr:Uncharacterised protein [Aggregatibacter aphrophilus]